MAMSSVCPTVPLIRLRQHHGDFYFEENGVAYTVLTCAFLTADGALRPMVLPLVLL